MHRIRTVLKTCFTLLIMCIIAFGTTTASATAGTFEDATYTASYLADTPTIETAAPQARAAPVEHQINTAAATYIKEDATLAANQQINHTTAISQNALFTMTREIPTARALERGTHRLVGFHRKTCSVTPATSVATSQDAIITTEKAEQLKTFYATHPVAVTERRGEYAFSFT